MSIPYRSHPPPYGGWPTKAAAATKRIDLEKGMRESGVNPVNKQGATVTSETSICGLFYFTTTINTRCPREHSHTLTANAYGLVVLFILMFISLFILSLAMLYVIQDL